MKFREFLKIENYMSGFTSGMKKGYDSGLNREQTLKRKPIKSKKADKLFGRK